MSLEGPTNPVPRVQLEVDEEKNVLVEIHRVFQSYIKPHQAAGIKFLYDAVVKNSASSTSCGAILAHSMGLGKTFQSIVFCHTIMTNPHTSKRFKRVMILSPSNVAKNWVQEFQKWCSPVSGMIDLFEMPARQDKRLIDLEIWHRYGGVLIMTLTLFSNMVNKTDTTSVQDRFLEYLVDPGPDLVIIDEGHLLKNEKSKINRAVSKFRTRHRIILTGTPLQNNLSEYFAMVDFVVPSLLGTKQYFKNQFEHPIRNGQHSDSTHEAVRLMKKRIHVLQKVLKDIIHRCDFRTLVPDLPAKHEYVLKLKLSDLQVQLYRKYVETCSQMHQKTFFSDFRSLGYIWNHPHLLRNLEKPEPEEEDEDVHCDFNDLIIQDNDRGSSNRYRMLSLLAGSDSKNDWYKSFIDETLNIREKIELSSKFVILLEILNKAEVVGDKVLLFTQSVNTLNLIEEFLQDDMRNCLDENPTLRSMTYDKIREHLNGCSHSWTPGVDFLRIDGSCSPTKRMKLIGIFNDNNNPRCRLMLVSTRAGSVGINLVGANRCIIFDCSWNPANDLQAVYRVFRYGQVKPVFIYRFVSFGTMENKVFDRQVLKLSLSHRVIDEKQIDRHFTASDLAELYEFNTDYDIHRKIPLIPKDQLLGQILAKHGDLFVETVEHDSLLENHPEEDLSEEERAAAWTEFNRLSYSPTGNLPTRYPGVSLLQQPSLIDLTKTSPVKSPYFVDDYLPLTSHQFAPTRIEPKHHGGRIAQGPQKTIPNMFSKVVKVDLKSKNRQPELKPKTFRERSEYFLSQFSGENILNAFGEQNEATVEQIFTNMGAYSRFASNSKKHDFYRMFSARIGAMLKEVLYSHSMESIVQAQRFMEIREIVDRIAQRYRQALAEPQIEEIVID